jgi:hypothetical protein
MIRRAPKWPVLGAALLFCMGSWGCEERLRSLPPVFPLRPYVAPVDAHTEPVFRDSAGLDLVHNGRVGNWGPHLLEATEARRIGLIDGVEPYVLHDVSDIAIDESGNVFAASSSGAFVQMYDSTGAFVRAFGRKGRGPNEFETADAVWLAGDTLVVIDQTLQRATALRVRDGAVLKVWPTQGESAWVRPVARGPSGWIAEVGPGVRVRGRQFTELILPPSVPLHTFHRETGAAGRLLYDVDMPEQVLIDSISGRRELPLFAVAPSYGFDGTGRLFLASDSSYDVTIFSDRGEPMRRIRRVYDPLPISSDAVPELVTFVESTFAHDTILRVYDRALLLTIQLLSEHPLPRAVPPLDRILVSRDGSFWVRRADAAQPGLYSVDRFQRVRPLPLPSRWELFSGVGEFLGTVDLPPWFYPMAVEGASVTGVQRDEYLVEYIVTYRVAAGRVGD